MVAEIAHIPFNAYGSVYFTTSRHPMFLLLALRSTASVHIAAQYTGTVARERKSFTLAQISVVDHVSCTTVDEVGLLMFTHVGITFDDYCQGLMESALARIPVSFPEVRLSHYGSLEELRDLVKQCRPVFKSLCQSKQIKNAAKPTLLHPDLHKRNVFVSSEDPTVITGIIDWQSTRVEPALLYGLGQLEFAALPNATLFEPQLPQDHEGQNKHDMMRY